MTRSLGKLEAGQFESVVVIMGGALGDDGDASWAMMKHTDTPQYTGQGLCELSRMTFLVVG